MYTLVNMVLHVNLRRDPWEALLHKPITDATCQERTVITHIFMATKRSWTTPLLSFEKVMNRLSFPVLFAACSYALFSLTALVGSS